VGIFRDTLRLTALQMRDRVPSMWHIYTLAEPESNTVRYVGKTSTSLIKRLQSHKSEAFRKTEGGKWYSTYHRAAWLRAIYSRGLIPVIQSVESGTGDWQAAERHWIAHFKGVGADLVNGTDGGEGLVGVVTTQQTRRLRSESSKAHWAALSPEERKQQSAHLHTPEAKNLRTENLNKYYQNLDQAARERLSIRSKEVFTNNPQALDEAKAALLRGVKRLWSDPEMREKAVARLRAQARRGADSPHAKLTVSAVQDIRRTAQQSYKGMIMALARKYKVDKKLISLVIQRKIWVDTPDG